MGSRQTSPDQLGPPGRGMWMVHRHCARMVRRGAESRAGSPVGHAVEDKHRRSHMPRRVEASRLSRLVTVQALACVAIQASSYITIKRMSYGCLYAPRCLRFRRLRRSPPACRWVRRVGPSTWQPCRGATETASRLHTEEFVALEQITVRASHSAATRIPPRQPWKRHGSAPKLTALGHVCAVDGGSKESCG